MNKNELHEARTNPEFLNYLEQTRVDAIATQNIQALYEVLDSLLILDLEEEKINSVYEAILTIAFEQIETIVNSGKKLQLKNDELFYVRSFYEHAIEKWSYNDFKGAKEFFYLLTQFIEDEKLINALKVHLVATALEKNLEEFYDTCVNTDSMELQEAYGYFIMHFQFDIQSYLKEHEVRLQQEQQQLSSLLDD